MTAWGLPIESIEIDDPTWGRVEIQRMTILTWQLWLAREIIEDDPLPWQKPQPQEKLTPGRVAQSLPAVLVAIGTPAHTPKPRGKSPGWEKGKKRSKKPRYPVVKKTVTRKKKEQKEQKEAA